MSKFRHIHPISPMTDDEIEAQLSLVDSVDGDEFPEWNEPTSEHFIEGIEKGSEWS